MKFGKIFPAFKQHDAMDCGPTCLAIISKYYGKEIQLDKLHSLCFITHQGVSLASNGYSSEWAKHEFIYGMKMLPNDFTGHDFVKTTWDKFIKFRVAPVKVPHVNMLIPAIPYIEKN